MGVNDNTEKANTETDKTIGIGKMMIVIMTMKCMTTISTKVTAVMWNHVMRKWIGTMF